MNMFSRTSKGTLDDLISHFFFFNDTATTEIYTLSLHDALPINRPRTPAAFASRPIRAASTAVVRTGSTSTSKPVPSSRMRFLPSSRFGLCFEGVSGECIGRQQIERQLAPAVRLARHPLEQRLANLRQVTREQGAGSREQLIDRAIDPSTERLRRRRPARVQPGQNVLSRHRLRSSLTMRGVCSRASRSFAVSPTP